MRAVVVRLPVFVIVGALCGSLVGALPSAAQPNVAASRAAPSTHVASALVKGTTEALLDDPTSALAHYEAALSQAPTAPALLQAVADAYAAQGAPTTALFYARQARRHGSARPYYHRRLAELQMRVEDRTAALNTYRTLCDRFPSYRPGCRGLAQLQETLNRPAAAIKTYNALLDATSRPRIDVYRSLLRLYRTVNDSVGTERILRTLVERRPLQTTHQRALAALYARSGRPDSALTLLAPLARRSPSDSTLQAAVARLARRAGRSQSPSRLRSATASVPPRAAAAEPLVQRARSLLASPRPDSARLHRLAARLHTALNRTPPNNAAGNAADDAAWAALARLERRRGRFEAAGDALHRSLAHNPRNVERWVRAASAFLQAPRYDRAVALAEEGLLLFPGHLPLAHIAARAHLQAGRPTSASAYFQDALQHVDSTAARIVARLYAGNGLALAQLGRTTAADSAVAAALAVAPTDPVVQRRVAYGLALQNKELDRALRIARRALHSGPASALLLDTLGWIHLQRGALAAARRRLNAALAAGPPSARLLEHLGALYDALGNDDAARSYWTRVSDVAPDRSVPRRH